MSAGDKLTSGFNDFSAGYGEMPFSDPKAVPDSLLCLAFEAFADPSAAGRGRYGKPEEPAADAAAIDNFRKMVLGNDL